ncbi:MAG TPA: TrbI/VirB10 family protein [Novosphingobium sp.]|nr:TrbI/VirB10 family protein [Novosphingobium sp.]
MGRLPENGGLVGETLPPPRMASANAAASPLVIDLTRGNGVGANDTPPAGDQGSGEETAHASLIAGRATLIPQGAIIAAVLETPLNSDRPGLARAVVAQDVRGFDGARVLIPRGSRLIGEFKAETSPGMRRIQVMWTRLIRPDGAAIRITSPAADTMGGAGIAGATNTHAIERFASAVLQSALTVGVNVASTMASGGSGTIYLGLPGQGTQLGQQLVPNTARPATIKVREGASISVLVARDLDFAGMPAVR